MPEGKEGHVEMPEMDDSTRAKLGYKVSKQTLIDLVDKYRQRKYIEDNDFIKSELNGIDGLLDSLNVHPENGIETQSLETRTQCFDTNEKEPPKRTPFYMLLLGALDDIMLKILMACAIVGMIMEYLAHNNDDPNAVPWYIDGVAIWMAVAVVSLVTAVSDYQKEGEFLKKQLIEENSKVVTVLRDGGRELVLHRNYIKVGDIVKIQNGMNVPVDGLVIHGIGVMSDESAMTGESDHLPKESMEKCNDRQVLHEAESQERNAHSVPSPILLSGTQIQTGEGWFLCIVVGEMTCEGQILSGIKATNETTPLQDKLEVIATDIGKVGMLAALLIFHVLLLRQFIEALIYRRFDLSGGPRKYYEFRIRDNVSGWFGAQLPQACGDDAACAAKFPISKHKLVDNPEYASIKGMQTGRCFGDPSAIVPNLSDQQLAQEDDRKQGEEAFQQELKNEQSTECFGQTDTYLREWLSYVMTGVAIVVVAVPEGLPLAVMISLAYSVKKMLVDQNFVKRLTSCEIMGGANNICSDKTGTLTKNIMTLTNIWCGADKKIENADNDNADGSLAPNFQQPLPFVASKESVSLLAEAISVNTTGTHNESVASEKAMLKFIKRCGVDYEGIRKNLLPKDMIRFVFDPVRKRMSTVAELEQPNEHGYNKRVHVKGASEIVLESCNFYLDEQGNKQPLNDDVVQKLKGLIESYAKQALRTFAFGYKDLKQNEGGEKHDGKVENGKAYEIEDSGLTLIALCGIKDIIREEVPGAVALCNEAGVRVRMVTGDNKTTAVAIAKECGIINEGEELENDLICMEGPEFNKYVGSLVHKTTRETIMVMGKDPEIEAIGDMEAMKRIRQHTKVLARSRPNDKYIMVFGLKELGDIVAVTGDGTNDAPALKKANVGFAMKTGTQVAHTAADIIIQDDNFASIVKACKWGRNVYDNIRRFLQFQLTVNVVALIVSFIASSVLKDPPLKPVQLLWVNMIMDSLASLALATELPVDELLHRPPYRKREYIISRRMVKHIGGQSIFQAFVLFFFVFAGPEFIKEEENMPPPFTNIRNGDYILSGMLQDFQMEPLYAKYKHITPSRHLTLIFNMFVWMQIFNMLCARKINDEINFLEGIHTNCMFICVLLFIIGLQIWVLTAWHYETKISLAFTTHLRGLTSGQWILSICIGLVTFPINFGLKFCPDEWCFIMGDEPVGDVQSAQDEYQTLLSIANKYKYRQGSNSKVMQQYVENKPGDSFKQR